MWGTAEGGSGIRFHAASILGEMRISWTYSGRTGRYGEHLGRGVPTRASAAPKVCHPERRAKPEAEGSSHRIPAEQTAGAKILRLASLAQNDIVGSAAPLSFNAVTVGRSVCVHSFEKISTNSQFLVDMLYPLRNLCVIFC